MNSLIPIISHAVCLISVIVDLLQNATANVENLLGMMLMVHAALHASYHMIVSQLMGGHVSKDYILYI